MNEKERLLHLAMLDEAEAKFDKEAGLTVFRTKKDAYHTKLADQDVHTLQGSVSYAVALLYGGRETDIERARKIISLVLTYQDCEPESRTYGIWPYYAEESLEEMEEPDWNAANFHGKLLLEVLYFHCDKLTDELAKVCEDACSRACESIMRRDMGVQYTNVAFMDALVTIATGQLLGEERLLSYGREKLRRFLTFVDYHGSVTEFNSPCYTPLLIRDIGTLLKMVKDPEARAYAQRINRVAWDMLAEHFRADMLQLAAPQGRAYSDYLGDQLMYDIELACEGEVIFDCEKKVGLETFWTKGSCPKELRGYFSGAKKPESSEKLIMKGFNYPFFAYVQTATTYHADNYTLGSFNREEFWNQRRPLMAYIKGEGKKPYCFRVSCLHDGYDLSSAQLHCVQEGGAILGAINISNNRGDTHICIDNTLNMVCDELAASFELEGYPETVTAEERKDGVVFAAGGQRIAVRILGAKFDKEKISYRLYREGNKWIYRVILLEGDKAEARLAERKDAYVCFTLDFEEEDENAACWECGEYIEAERMANGKKLKIKTGKGVKPFIDLMYWDWQWKDGVQLEALLERNS